MKKTLFALIFICTAFSLSAKSFSLQVIQKNTPGEVILDTSYVVEQAILDYFFERGMIVSNNTVLVSQNDEVEDTKALRLSFIEAQCGCMELFIKLYLNYTIKDSLNPTAILLSNIKNAEIEIVSIETTEVLVKGTYTPRPVTAQNNNRGGVESFATDIAKDIQAKLDKKGGAK